jgi:macrolide transport system ATP-binding/permease protein
MKALWRDLRQTFRTLRGNPGFTASVVLSLALGIGVNTAVFSWIDAALLRPLPIAGPERVVSVHTVLENRPDYLTVSYPNFLDYQEAADVFSDLVVYRPVKFSLTSGDEPELVNGQLVSGTYFEMLGLRPAAGRFFRPEEDAVPGRHPVVVLGHGLWRRRFGGDPGLIGRTVTLNGHRFTVIGVAPEGFRGARILEPAEMWAPLMMYKEVLPGRMGKIFEQRRAIILFCLGRLKPGVDIQQAETAMKTIAKRLEQAYPDDNRGRSLALLPIQRFTISPNYRDNYVLAASVLLGVVGLVLLTACANVANLLLARWLSRRKEVAVRLALGASRPVLLRQLLTESLTLALLGGAAGLLVAELVRRMLWLSRPINVPESLDVGLNPRVLAFTVVLSLVTGLLFGLAPALQSSRADLVTALRNQAALPARTGGRPGLRDLLVAVQIAVSLISLIGAGLFLASSRAAEGIDPGFETRRMLLASFDPGAQGYDETRGQQLYRQVVERVETLPGVRSAAVAEYAVLLGDVGLRRTVVAEGKEPPPGETGYMVQINGVSHRYFETVGVPILQGRGFTAEDRQGASPVAVVNDEMAARLWPGEPAVGRKFQFFGAPGSVEVVGVARNSKYGFLGEETPLYLYLPMAQNYGSEATLHVRTEGDPAELIEPVRRTVRELDPRLPLVDVRTVSRVLDDALWPPRTAARLLASFGLLALALAAIGIYGVIGYLVRQNRREIAVRLALGAQRGDVLGHVVRRGMGTVALGVAAGLLVAFALVRTLSALLYGTAPLDPLAWGIAALLLAVVALAATWLPARRAAGIDPILVLREP